MKRRRDDSPASKSRRRAINPTTENQRDEIDQCQPDASEIAPNIVDDQRSMRASIAPAAASMSTTGSPDAIFDSRFYRSSQGQPTERSLETSLMPSLPPMNSAGPTFDPRYSLTATDMFRLEQQRVMPLHNSEFNRINQAGAAPFSGMESSIAATALSTDRGTAVGIFDRLLVAQLSPFRVHQHEQSQPFHSGVAHASTNLPQNQDIDSTPTSHADNRDNQDSKSLPAVGPPTPEQQQHPAIDQAARQPEPKPVTLYTAEDRRNLNQNQILLRQQIEVFRATVDDLGSRAHGKSKHISLQQVGVRCLHCRHLPVTTRSKASTYFPKNLMGIYQAAQNISVEHLQSGLCPGLPAHMRERFSSFASRKLVPSGGGKKYWADSGKALGLIDTDDGIRFASDVMEEMDGRKSSDRALQS